MKKQVTIDLRPDQIGDTALIRKIAARACRVPEEDISAIEYLKRSLDSRNKRPRWELALEVYCGEQPIRTAPLKESYRDVGDARRVIIVGAGPAGYFAALELLEHGIKPVILERGKDVRSRRKDIRSLMQEGFVNGDSNYCFGEGGAGAYSDGKLYTRSDKRGSIRKVLQILTEHGADPDILIDAHPHIGSNKLPHIISAIRDTITAHGGEVRFDSRVTDLIIRGNRVAGAIVNGGETVEGSALILATGHSARDIFYMFADKQITMEAKPFAVGFRAEHPQELINTIQYGPNYSRSLPPASYKLTAQCGGRGVFSFCMCPGGVIVPSVTASQELVVNGMSNSGRNSRFANSGIVTTVAEADFAEFSSFGALAGLKYQEQLESRFYTGDVANPLKAPAQRLLDFIGRGRTSELGESSYIPGLIARDLRKLFPADTGAALRAGLRTFGDKMRGYLTESANLIGLESRTSSPVRIPRQKESYRHPELENLYPCGEGSGYAGGIVSSAIDGQNCAQALAKGLGA